MDFLSTLALDLAASWTRILTALFASIVFGILVGIAAATSRVLERIILPILDILQTIPILGFFPIVIFLVVSYIPGYIGVNIAVVFLIFTSMSWNIAFGVYESAKSLPQELHEIAALYGLSPLRKLFRIYIPAALPRIAYQSTISFSIGLFYLATSEIFSTGSANFAVTYGVGIEIAKLAASAGSFYNYLLAIIGFLIAVILTRVFLLRPFSAYSEKFSLSQNDNAGESAVLRLYSLIGKILIKPIMSLRPRRPKRRVVVSPRIPQAKKPYKLVRHKHFAHIYALLGALVLVLLAILLLNTSQLGEEVVVLSALAASFVRVWATYIACAAISLPLGICIALSKRGFEAIMSVLQVLSSIPAPILMPALIALLAGTAFFSEALAISVIFISMIWYILFSMVSGMRTIPASIFEAARSNRLGWVQLWRKVYIPASLPSFVTGSITAVGGAWNSLIIAEYFTVQSNSQMVVLGQVGTGIGKLIDTAVFSGNTSLMLLSIISMTIMVVVVNRLLWQKVYNRVTTRYRIEV